LVPKLRCGTNRSFTMQPVPVKEHNLNKLKKWLNYELGGSVIFYFYFIGFFTWTILMVLAILCVAILLPLLIKVLIEQKRYGWLISFFIFIVAPPLFMYIRTEDWYCLTISAFFSIGCFYFYCALLRLIIPEWNKKIVTR